MTLVDSTKLWRWANKRFLAGKFSTFKEAAQRFRCSYNDIEDAIENYDGVGYLGASVGIGIPGVGFSPITPRGEWIVEAYE